MRSDLLLNGHTQSCGCLKSLGEQKVDKILRENNINFYSQYRFDDCINDKTGFKLIFDFYLYEYNTIIEYDGSTHYIDTSGWFKKSSLDELQRRDEIKNQYCKSKNIKLIRIPYTDYDIIDINYIMERINE